MTDTLTTQERSERMSRVTSRGNKSTEMRVADAFEQYGIGGWISHPKDIPGTPDFYFPEERVVVFVNGCFWHGCPKCGRIPKSKVVFWVNKIQSNKRRDLRVRRQLRSSGCKVLTVWEHSLRSSNWIRRVQRALTKG